MKKYQIIYADPPWGYANKPAKSGSSQGFAADRYPLMKLEDLKGLPVSEIADKDSVLLMWATFPMLKQALELMEAWGFIYRTTAFTWHKLNPKSGTDFFGLGYYTRSNNEVCLLGMKGNVKVKSHNVFQVLMTPRGKHSEKPQEARDRIIQLFGDIPRIELFARQKTEGWDVWGNEVKSDIEL